MSTPPIHSAAKKTRRLLTGSKWRGPTGEHYRVTSSTKESVDCINITSGGNAVFGRRWFEANFVPQA